MTDLLNILVGEWSVEARHPAFPGLVVAGRAGFEWLEGGHFLILRSQAEHPDFPDALWVIGDGKAHYFDSRGVRRVYEMSVGEAVWRIWRDEPGFAQRFEGRLSDDGDTFSGVWELSRDDETYESDLEILYRRA
jgi:hypothetical protein